MIISIVQHVGLAIHHHAHVWFDWRGIYQFLYVYLAAKCESINTFDNGVMIEYVGNNATIGTMIRFVCMPDYELIGASTLECMANMQWNDSVPYCRRMHVVFIYSLIYIFSENMLNSNIVIVRTHADSYRRRRSCSVRMSSFWLCTQWYICILHTYNLSQFLKIPNRCNVYRPINHHHTVSKQ